MVLDSVTDPFSSGMKRAASDAETESKRMSGAIGAVAKVGLGLGIAVVGIGVASVKAATEFQTQMTRLYTAAGAPKAAVEAATGAVLQLGTQVGMTGTQIAEALYHPISAGLDMATSLQVVKYAAEEAQISGASLDDTTYSLSSVMKAFNLPATQAAQTMADLNAVVGDGDMHFQDFNTSIKNWAPTAAQMGISVNSMGAGLAYLTDRGNSAEEASTRLTMGLSMMATPSKQAASLLEGLGVASSDVKGSTDVMTKTLQKAGITQNQLASDLAKPDGLYVALNHLKTSLENAGVSGTEADSTISKIFGGGRSDKAIMSLMQNLDGLKQKYDQITSDATTSKFTADWEGVKSTFGFQIHQMEVGIENFGIELGTKALPVLSSFISTAEKDLGSFFGQVSSGFSGADLQAPKVNFHNAGLDQLTQPQTAFERFGQTVHTALGDLEAFGKRLIPIGQNFETFGIDVFQAGEKIVTAITPTVELIGKGLFAALELAGQAAANILGPAIKSFADFLAAHQGAIKFFSEVILGGLILKMTIIGALNAAKGILGIATAIVSFPLGQASQIGEAFTALKTAFTGKEAVEGEQAVQGLAGAFSKLKTAGSNILDKILPDSGKLAALSQMGTDIKGIETAASTGGEQLSLLDGNLQAIPWKMGHEQAALFDTDMVNAGTDAETAATGIDKAATSTGSLAGTLGKLGLVGGVIAGIALAAPELGKLAGVGDQTTIAMDRLTTAFSLAGSGSTQAQTQIAQGASGLVYMSGVFGHSMAGLQQMDQSLAQLVSSGHGAAAKTQFDQIAQSLKSQGLDAQQAAAKFPQYEQALKDAGDAAQTMDGQVQGMMGALQKQQALTQFNSDLVTLTQSIQTNGNALSGNSQQAVANQQAISGAMTDIVSFYQSQRNAGVGIGAATTQMDQQIQALEKTAINSGIAKGDVDKYIATLLNIPASQVTQILADIKPAQYGLATLLKQINSSSGTITVYETSTGSVGSTQTKVQARASGGAVQRDNTYWVGENGPELVTFGANGYVTPTNMLQPAALTGAHGSRGGGGGTVVYQTIFQVAGSITSEDQLLRKLQTKVLQYNGRNSSNGLSLP